MRLRPRGESVSGVPRIMVTESFCPLLPQGKAYEVRNSRLLSLNVRPAWDPLRDDPPFQDLLLRMNLEP